MATLSPNASPAYAPVFPGFGSMGGARAASNGTGTTSAMRRYLRSSRGGEAKVHRAWDEENRNTQKQWRDKDISDERAWREKQAQLDRDERSGVKRQEWDGLINGNGGQTQRPANGMLPAPRGNDGVPLNKAGITDLKPMPLSSQNSASVGGGVANREGANVTYQDGGTIQPSASITAARGQAGYELNTKHGTGHATFAPEVGPREPATFEGQPAAQYFQAAANRQGLANQYAQPQSIAPATNPPAGLQAAPTSNGAAQLMGKFSPPNSGPPNPLDNYMSDEWTANQMGIAKATREAGAATVAQPSSGAPVTTPQPTMSTPLGEMASAIGGTIGAGSQWAETGVADSAQAATTLARKVASPLTNAMSYLTTPRANTPAPTINYAAGQDAENKRRAAKLMAVGR